MHGYDKRTPGEAMDTECIPWPPPPPNGWFGDAAERPEGEGTSFADFFSKGPSSSSTD
ncbi:hypothetical protein [Saccharopolyspora sp. NPDC049357]|uniref:hypothetical protein n=1 Tax=Saccharopolyspora sp. NPDC049357 TaxID=3154507 RepID=UPI0034187E6E